VHHRALRDALRATARLRPAAVERSRPPVHRG
jgi:hypothetical protein